MLKKIIRRISEGCKKRGNKYYLHEYRKNDGTFDYDQYKKIQIEGNKSKINRLWVKESSVDFLSEYIKNRIGKPNFGICHGTRRGLEQQWFYERLGCEVIGTEISDTAGQYPNTVQWDFHEENPDWLGRADFIYTNSFDHAYNPEKALSNWMKMLKPGGICLIEHSEAHGVGATTKLDPFGASLDIMPFLILEWGKGRYSVRDILHENPEENELYPRSFLVVENN